MKVSFSMWGPHKETDIIFLHTKAFRLSYGSTNHVCWTGTQMSGSGSSHPKVPGFRFHNPDRNILTTERCLFSERTSQHHGKYKRSFASAPSCAERHKRLHRRGNSQLSEALDTVSVISCYDVRRLIINMIRWSQLKIEILTCFTAHEWGIHRVDVFFAQKWQSHTLTERNSSL